jgi:hypothetical protein
MQATVGGQQEFVVFRIDPLRELRDDRAPSSRGRRAHFQHEPHMAQKLSRVVISASPYTLRNITVLRDRRDRT